MAEGSLPKIALKWMPKKREHEEDQRKTDGRNEEGHERKKRK